MTPFTEDDVEMCAALIADRLGTESEIGHVSGARKALEWLAATGRLLPESAKTSEGNGMADLTTVEEYAIWLAETGVADSAQDDMNEGGDPITERGDEVSEEDWIAATDLAQDIAVWIRDNPETMLRLVREAT